MPKVKRETYNERKHREGNERVCEAMSERGYVSLFEHVHPAIESQTVYTLWVNLSRPFQMMTIVDNQGGVGFYTLMPELGFDRA